MGIKKTVWRSTLSSARATLRLEKASARHGVAYEYSVRRVIDAIDEHINRRRHRVTKYSPDNIVSLQIHFFSRPYRFLTVRAPFYICRHIKASRSFAGNSADLLLLRPPAVFFSAFSGLPS